jgi:hypothetical protein
VRGQERGFEAGEVEGPRRHDRLDAGRAFEEGGESQGAVAVLLDARGDVPGGMAPEERGDPLGAQGAEGPGQELLDLVPPPRHERAGELLDLPGHSSVSRSDPSASRPNSAPRARGSAWNRAQRWVSVEPRQELLELH